MEFIFQILSQLLPAVENDQNNIQQKIVTEEAIAEKELVMTNDQEEVAETNLFSMMEFH
ncbi:MAG: hypothetical protein JEZ14_12910 [Marinilabiliaceae bacterium]|nr:hypothetical protein [Marinilabiliaceae bacterium]